MNLESRSARAALSCAVLLVTALLLLSLFAIGLALTLLFNA